MRRNSIRHGVSAGVTGHGQIMAPLNQNPMPLWYYPSVGGGEGGAKVVQGKLKALRVWDGAAEHEAEGKTIGEIEVERTSCTATQFKNTRVEAVDWSGCIFDKPFEDLDDVWVWLVEDWQESIEPATIPNPDFDPQQDPGPENPETIPNPDYAPGTFVCGWAALDRCCVPEDFPTTP